MIEKDIHTPCFIINKQKFQDNCNEVRRHFDSEWKPGKVLYGYSVKTNNHRTLLQLAKDMDFGAEVVSENEYRYAVNLGFPVHKIILNGPIKGNALLDAWHNGSIVNVDNFEEIERLCKQKTPIPMSSHLLGIRVNFDVASLLKDEDRLPYNIGKYGICYENGDFGKAIELLRKNNLCITGLHMHTSSQLRSLALFRILANKACQLSRKFDLKLKYIDIGGGLWGGAIREGRPLMSEYASEICNTLKTTFKPSETMLILEPGTALLVTSLVYRSKVITVKDVRGTIIVILDGTALHINPFCKQKQFHYRIYSQENTIVERQEICGGTTMENDRFFTLDNAPLLRVGDFIEFEWVGAYTTSFNSNFVLPLPQVYLKVGNKYKACCST